MKFLIVFAAFVAVAVARPRVSTWTLQELSDALQNPHINPELVPVLEQALNDLMTAIHAGDEVQSIVVPLPADVTLIPEPVILPSPVLPEIPSPVEQAPTSTPLVQIIINVNGQQQVANVVAPVRPTPVQVVDGPQDVIFPGPVIVGPLPVNPVDVIAVNPGVMPYLR